jgi:homeobox protein cut-like
MNMMVAEEAKASSNSYEDDSEQVVNGHEEREIMSDPDNKFQKAIAAWRGIYVQVRCTQQNSNVFAGIDLTTLVSKLDTTASDVVAHQRDSLVQRKDLAQKTKDFRKLDEAGKLGEYKGLLKGMRCTTQHIFVIDTLQPIRRS